MKRYLESSIEDDLSEKMVFVGGPRQVGKTTMALRLLQDGHEKHPAYLNWDSRIVQKLLLGGGLPAEQPLIILDGIHKYKGWRNLVKGFYDTHKSDTRFLITGSARLDYYRRGGDSLQGRYHYYRLHPLSLYEINSSPDKSDLEQLMCFGGFPEPFLSGNIRSWKRWQRERQSRVIHEDLLSLENVKEVSQLDLLARILPERVGAPLSLNSLKQDLMVAFETVDRWINILENLYFCFRIKPFGLPHLRAVKKEQKLYLWDWSQCVDEGARFENLVASHLLKYCHFHEDRFGDQMELQFIRDQAKREIDFVVVKENKPLFAVECKSGQGKLSPNIAYFAKRSSIPIFYQVHLKDKDYSVKDAKARVLPFASFCKMMKL